MPTLDYCIYLSPWPQARRAPFLQEAPLAIWMVLGAAGGSSSRWRMSVCSMLGGGLIRILQGGIMQRRRQCAGRRVLCNVPTRHRHAGQHE